MNRYNTLMSLIYTQFYMVTHMYGYIKFNRWIFRKFIFSTSIEGINVPILEIFVKNGNFVCGKKIRMST